MNKFISTNLDEHMLIQVYVFFIFLFKKGRHMAGQLDSIFTGVNAQKTVSDFRNNTSQALSRYKGDVVKAISPVQNKLKEGVAFIKSTESKVAATITGYKEEVIENLNSIVGSLTGGLFDFSDASKYLSVGPNGVSFDKQGLAAEIGGKIGLDLSTNTSLMYQMTNLANEEFGELTGGYFGNMVTTDGSSFRITENWRSQLGGGLLDVLGRTTGINNTLLDSTFTMSYYNSLMKMSAQYGMSDSYKSIMDKYINKADAETALINSIPYMMQSGDLISLGKVLDLVSKERYAVINAKYPQLIDNIFSNFSLDPGTETGKFPEIKALFLRVCTTIYGAEWYYQDTGLGKAYNLGLISNVSDDMKKVLMSDETASEIVAVMCCAGMFSESSAIDTFKGYFPGVPMLEIA